MLAELTPSCKYYIQYIFHSKLHNILMKLSVIQPTDTDFFSIHFFLKLHPT